MGLRPQIVLNTTSSPIFLNDVRNFDDTFIKLMPGVSTDLFLLATDEDLTKSQHLKHLVEIGALTVVTYFDTNATQATAVTGGTDAVKLQGVDISDATPTDGQVLKYVGANSNWEPSTSSGGLTFPLAAPADNNVNYGFDGAAAGGGLAALSDGSIGLFTAPGADAAIVAAGSNSEASIMWAPTAGAFDQSIVNCAENSIRLDTLGFIAINSAELYITGDNSASTGKVLGCIADNGLASWVTTSGSPASPDESVQFNSSGSFSGSSDLLWHNDGGVYKLGINLSGESGAASPTRPLDVVGGIRSRIASGTQGQGGFLLGNPGTTSDTWCLRQDTSYNFRIERYTSFAWIQSLYIDNVSGSMSLGTSTPHSSAMLDVSSTTRGFLPPRMDTPARNTIPSPAAGLMVFDTNLSQWMGYNGTAWVTIG